MSELGPGRGDGRVGDGETGGWGVGRREGGGWGGWGTGRHGAGGLKSESLPLGLFVKDATFKLTIKISFGTVSSVEKKGEPKGGGEVRVGRENEWDMRVR